MPTNTDTNRWKKINLGEIMSVLTDYTANGSFASLKENVTYYSVPNYAVLVRTTDLDKSTFKPERFTDEKGYKYLKKTSLFGGEIILANVGSVGKVFRVPKYEQPMTLAPNTYLIKFNENTDKEYIFQWLSSDEFRRKLLSIIGSTTLQAINKDNLRSLELSLPKDIKEQEKIASILSNIDSSIEKTEQLINKYKSIKQGLMQDLFRYGIDENGQIRSEKTHKFKDSPLGRIPEDWEVYQFSELLEQIIDFRGKTPKKIGMDWGGGNIPALSANNVEMGRINFDKETYYGSESLYKKWMNKGDCTEGDIVMTMEAPLGNVAQIPDKRKYILSQRVVLFKPSELLDSLYFKYQLMSNQFQYSLFLDSTGTTATGIQQKKLLKIRLFIPSNKEEQKKIAATISKCDQSIETEEIFMEKLIAIKKGLMQDLLTGKVRVNHLLN